MTKLNPQNKVIKKDLPAEKDLTVKLTVVPQGAMVKPKSFIVALDGKALKAFIKETMNS